MPNWVSNEMTIIGTERQVQKVLESIRGENGAIDFELIVAQPECIKKTPDSGSEARTAQEYLNTAGRNCIEMFKKGYRTTEMKEEEESWESWRKDIAENPDKNDDLMKSRYKMSYVELMLNYFDCLCQTGCVDWDDWNCKYWGTKWHACESSVNGNTITFDTAWSAPRAIFIALARKFPNVTIEVESANEDYAIPVTLYRYKYNKKKDKVVETLIKCWYREYPDDWDEE